jgi:chorismate mutase / prephenate dehydratase
MSSDRHAADAPTDEAAKAVAAVDEKLIQLLNQRFALTKQVAQSSGQAPLDLAAADLEKDVLPRLLAANAGPLQPATLKAIYREIIAGEQSLLQPVTVSFMGPELTYSHQATLKKFGASVKSRCRANITEVFDDVNRDQVTYGVVPVENSTEGAVTVTFDLLPDTGVKIVAELYLRIHNHLMGRCPLAEIKTVYSHPQPFAQCRRWLQQNLPGRQLVEVASTAAAAARAANEPGTAAIASILAADHYGLQVLAHKIEDLTENTTRFMVLSRHLPPPTGDDKTSLVFAVDDRVGALYDALLPFKEHQVNLTMIQSRPSKRKSWDYYFFVDFLGHIDDPAPSRAIAALRQQCRMVKHLGSYPRAQDPV